MIWSIADLLALARTIVPLNEAHLAALYRFAASLRPVTRLATPSTDRKVLAFSFIQ